MMDFNQSALENFYSKSTFEGKEILIKEKELMIFCPFHIKNLFLMNDRKKERRSGFFCQDERKECFFCFLLLAPKLDRIGKKLSFVFLVKENGNRFC